MQKFVTVGIGSSPMAVNWSRTFGINALLCAMDRAKNSVSLTAATPAASEG